MGLLVTVLELLQQARLPRQPTIELLQEDGVLLSNLCIRQPAIHRSIDVAETPSTDIVLQDVTIGDDATEFSHTVDVADRRRAETLGRGATRPSPRTQLRDALALPGVVVMPPFVHCRAVYSQAV